MTPKQEAAHRRERERQIEEALALLKPPADRVKQCRAHVGEWLNYLESARRVAAVTKKETDRYIAAAERLQAVSKTYKGPRMFGQSVIDQKVALHKGGITALVARSGVEDPASLPPLKPGYFAAVGAYELLSCWVRKPRANPKGDWHKLAKILRGDGGNIYHYLRKVQSEQDRRERAGVDRRQK